MKFSFGSMFLGVLLVGCSPAPTTDAGSDTGVGMDVTVADSASDIGVEIGADIGTDVGADIASDATDVAPIVDVQPEAAAPTGCAGLVTCLAACSSQTCMDGCMANTTSQGTDLYNTVVMCSDLACDNTPDGGFGPCPGGPTDMSASCLACISDTRHGGAAGPCANPSSRYCGSCSTEYDACLADH